MSTLRRISLAVFLSFPPSCSGLLKVHFKRPVSGTPNITTDVTCSGVLLQLCSRPSILLISSTIWCRFWLISAPLLSENKRRKNRRENCSTAASQSGCVQLSVRLYATKHLRDTNSDYVMKKPSRCWLGAVPRYWKVVASCFQNVSFAENTSAPLAPRARIFQPILLLFFLFSCS